MIWFLNIIFTGIIGVLLAGKAMCLGDALKLYKIIKNRPKVFAVSIWKINFKLIRGIAMIGILIILMLLSVNYFAFNKYTFIYFIFFIVLLLFQGCSDILLGLVTEMITEYGVLTQNGFKEYCFVNGFSWKENKDLNNFTVSLKIFIERKEIGKEFIVEKDIKDEVDEFLHKKIRCI